MRPRIPVMIGAVVLSLSALACGNKTDARTSSSGRSSSTAQSINLTGCLQQGPHGTYVLTALNSPAQPDSSNPTVVGREKLAAAEDTYRLTSNDDHKLAVLVGDTVRLEGALTEHSDLTSSNNGARPVATAGQAIESGQKSVAVDDLAEVNVRTIQKVTDTCGSSR